MTESARVGGVLLLPLLSLGAGHLGLRWTLAMLGLLAFVLLLGMSKVIDRLGSGRGEPQSEKSPPATKLTRRDLLGTARFRSLALSFSVAIFIQVGIYSQLINRLRPVLGFDGAAFAMTGCMSLAIFGRLALSWYIGQINQRAVAALNFLMQSIGMIALAVATEPLLAIAGCVLFGLGLGNLPLLPPLIVQEEFE